MQQVEFQLQDQHLQMSTHAISKASSTQEYPLCRIAYFRIKHSILLDYNIGALMCNMLVVLIYIKSKNVLVILQE